MTNSAGVDIRIELQECVGHFVPRIFVFLLPQVVGEGFLAVLGEVVEQGVGYSIGLGRYGVAHLTVMHDLRQSAYVSHQHRSLEVERHLRHAGLCGGAVRLGDEGGCTEVQTQIAVGDELVAQDNTLVQTALEDQVSVLLLIFVELAGDDQPQVRQTVLDLSERFDEQIQTFLGTHQPEEQHIVVRGIDAQHLAGFVLADERTVVVVDRVRTERLRLLGF